MNDMPHATAEGDQSLTRRSSFSENGSNSNGSSAVGNNNNNGMAANQAEYYNKMNYLMKLSEETHELERRYNMLQSSSDGSNNANDAADKGKAKAGYDKAMTEKQNYFLQLSRENRELERRNNLMTMQQLNYNTRRDPIKTITTLRVLFTRLPRRQWGAFQARSVACFIRRNWLRLERPEE